MTPAGATESRVDTDIPHSQPAGAFDGLSVRIGTDSFRVIESEASSPLRLRVANIGAEDEIRPEARARCSVPIPPGHDLHTDFGDAPPWAARVLVVPFNENVTVEPGGSLRRYEAFLPAPGEPRPRRPRARHHAGGADGLRARRRHRRRRPHPHARPPRRPRALRE